MDNKRIYYIRGVVHMTALFKNKALENLGDNNIAELKLPETQDCCSGCPQNSTCNKKDVVCQKFDPNEQKPMFKVGDKVRVKNTDDAVHTITDFAFFEDGTPAYCLDNIAGLYQEEWLELVNISKLVVSLRDSYIGKKVIVVDKCGGRFFGTLEARDGQIVKLSNCRKIYYTIYGNRDNVSIAIEGVRQSKDYKFTQVVESMLILTSVEIIPCSDKAIEIMESVDIVSA